ncbi:MAG TPA: hypothetical protein VIF60_00155 [Burkholderiaceae bacterium]
MDLNKLRTHVFEQTGIKVDTTDPIFALVALNEAVLSECIGQQLTGLNESAEKLKEQTQLLVQAGDRTKRLLLQMGKAVDDPVAPAPESREVANPLSRFKLPGLVAATAVCSALLVILAQTIMAPARQPLPAATQVSAAPAAALTAEQIQLIQNGEKYAKVWPKLDAKTQAKIQALLQ